jgi:NADH-quinone oxidoreductase subunit E
MNLTNKEENLVRVQEELMLSDIKQCLGAFERNQGALIPILRMIQDKYSYLSKDAIRLVADHIDISPSEVYGVATFYNQYRFNQPGKHLIKVCLGTACHVKGGDIILENFERKLGIKCSETTPDREYTIERVACAGCCAIAPVTIVDSRTEGHMSPSRVEGILLGFQIEQKKGERESKKGVLNEQ